MTIDEVVNKAVSDPVFAKKLCNSALKVCNEGRGSNAWQQWLTMFANSPQDLAKMQTMGKQFRKGRKFDTTTWGNAITTTPACTAANSSVTWGD